MSPTLELGVRYFLQRKYDTALRQFDGILREEPTNARAWSYYGICLAHMGRGREAETAISQAIQLAPTSAQTWFHLGVARSLREEWPEAARAYRETVALEPRDLVAWHRLGVALAQCGDEPGAADAFQRALRLSRTSEAPRPPASDLDPLGPLEAPSDGGEGMPEAKSWLDLALSLLSLGEEEGAIAAYERAYRLDASGASASLFRPMLHLVTAARLGPEVYDATLETELDRRMRPPRPRDPTDGYRPEIR